MRSPIVIPRPLRAGGGAGVVKRGSGGVKLRSPRAWLARVRFTQTKARAILLRASGKSGCLGPRGTPPAARTAATMRRQRLANRLRPELGEDRPQRADARREGVTVVLDDVV